MKFLSARRCEMIGCVAKSRHGLRAYAVSAIQAICANHAEMEKWSGFVHHHLLMRRKWCLLLDRDDDDVYVSPYKSSPRFVHPEFSVLPQSRSRDI